MKNINYDIKISKPTSSVFKLYVLIIFSVVSALLSTFALFVFTSIFSLGRAPQSFSINLLIQLGYVGIIAMLFVFLFFSIVFTILDRKFLNITEHTLIQDNIGYKPTYYYTLLILRYYNIIIVTLFFFAIILMIYFGPYMFKQNSTGPTLPTVPLSGYAL